jgi:hypothetical protein
MSCALLDFGCHVGSFLAPVQAFWATWWPLGLFVSGLIIGGILGWRVVLAVLTLGVGYFLYDRFKPIPEPIETDLSPRDREPAPKKPKPILADTSIFEDFMTRLRKRK